VVANHRSGRRFERNLCVVALTGTVAVFVAGTRVVGGLEAYLTLPATAIGTLLWAAAALTVSAELAERIGSRRSRSAAWLGAAAITATSLWLSVTLLQSHPERTLQVPQRTDPAALAISEQIRAAIPPGTDTVLIEPDVPNGPAISTAAMVANQIELGGFDARADASLEHFFGRHRRATGCETVAVSIGSVGVPIDPAAGEVTGTFNNQIIQIRALDPGPGCT
jgi:hypothetical protein